MMEAIEIRNLYDLKETIAAPLLEQARYPSPWAGRCRRSVLRSAARMSGWRRARRWRPPLA